MTALAAPHVVTCAMFLSALASDDAHYLHRFERQQLVDQYYSEGANAGDLNRDGVADLVYGPHWYEGPDFKRQHEIYPPVVQDRNKYADHFFAWIHDFNSDGWNDVFTVGFPGTPAFVYENPGNKSDTKHWTKHTVFDWVSNESPHFTNLVGDAKPELICSRDGYYGYATPDWSKPFEPWKFHVVSDRTADPRFGHGLGVGDVNGDGRSDLLVRNGWHEQPADLTGEPKWAFHAFEFTRAGGSDMHAYDVDGDGDNDVITTLTAHDFGLAWFEQFREGGESRFRKHVIMGSTTDENRYGVLFSELHSLALADIDGDGLKDIVTGKTYWSHHRQSPMWDAGAVVYYFKLVRGPEGVDWVPFRADDDSGIGRQLIVTDLDRDGLPDIVAGGMKGAHVLRHRRQAVDAATWQDAQPVPARALRSGLQPAEAAQNMTVPAGFRVQLVASEPSVHQPIALAIDPRGRVWIAEAHTYPNRAPDGQGKDNIVILEDTNGDGTLDSRKVFTSGLNLVSGLELGFGGVWVGAAPYLYFIPDRDGDDRPDGPPQVLLDGWGFQDTHETLNAFNWGPDGWLYGCHGVFTHSRVGKPGTPDAQRVPLNAGIWRYHPTRHEFEVFAWGTSNPWGVDFDDHGQAFATACVIPHLWHVVQGARYQRQAGQHFDPYVFADIGTIADHAHYRGDIRDHAWWGHEPQAPSATLAAGGGHAHCGAMVYLGDNWPAAFRNRIFMSNIHGNRVNSDIVSARGSGFVGTHGPDLLIANDRWFRAINLKCGPDGSVYVIDWYDPNACHRVNPEIWDRTNGRVYNVSWGEPKRTAVNLAALSDAMLASLHEHPNDWYVRTARRLLQERVATKPLARDAIDHLCKVARDPSVPRRLRAIWTLHVVGELTESDRLQLLGDASDAVRAWAVQLEMEDRAATSPVCETFAKMAHDERSPMVRLYLAAALQRLSPSERWPIADGLVRHESDATDHNLPLLIWYGIEPLVSVDAQKALELAGAARIPLLRRFIVRRAAADNVTLDLVARSLASGSASGEAAWILDEMLAAFEGRVGIPMPPSWSAAYDSLQQHSDVGVRERADRVAVLFGDRRIFPRMRSLLADRSADAAARKQALEILLRGRDADAAPALQAAVADATLRGAAIRGLAHYADRRTPELLLAAYSRMVESDKRDVVSTLVSRPAYGMALLDAVAAGHVPRTDLHAYHVLQLQRFNDAALNQRIQSAWGAIRETAQDKQATIARFKARLSPAALEAGDASNGRRVFAKVCASCHTLFGEGGKVGPDITGSNRADLDYVLQNVVDPSAVLGNDYRLTALGLKDGRVVAGLVQRETDSALTVRTLNDTVVVARTDLEDRRLTEQSMMPDNLLDALSAEDVRDLIKYVGGAGQVPLRGPRAPIAAASGRVRDALEGESLKILRKTRGSAASQNMDPFRADRWSGSDQLWWTGAQPGDQLELELPVAKSGSYQLELVLTRARDYGIVQLELDGDKLGDPIDLYNSPEVVTTGVLEFESRSLTAGSHRLTVRIVGTNPRAVPAYMFALDYVRLVETK